MTYKASRCPGLEAPLRLIRRAHFYRSLAPRHRDALHLHDLVGWCCRRDGHTFLLERDVERNWAYMRDKAYAGHRLAEPVRDVLG